MSNSTPEHEALHHGFLLVHTAIRRSVDSIVTAAGKPIPDGDRAGFADFCERLSRFVHGHHDAEEELFFPMFKTGALAKDVETWRADHHALLGELDAFDAAVRQFKTGGSLDAVATTATRVRDVLFPHLDAEEAALDISATQKAVTAAQAIELAQAASKHGQRHGGPRVLMLFLHALTNDEQRAHFGKMPWFVRKVLVRIWDRGFQPCLKYGHNPAIAL